MNPIIPAGPPRVDPLSSLYKFHTTVDVLRLDLIHPVISGNKWYKLRYSLEEALQQEKKAVVTFGGAYSNHIVATAAACREAGLKSIGIIRGERSLNFSQTLQNAEAFGMQLFFISREAYREKALPDALLTHFPETALYTISEGGYGHNGARGAAEILSDDRFSDYTHFLAATGTGTTLAGLATGCRPGQQAIGISVLKGALSLNDEIIKLTGTEKKENFSLLHDYHFGGYARKNAELTAFMNEWFRQTGIPSDFVYTAKLFFAVQDLLQKDFFPQGSRLLVIHSGGLQGNRSLEKGTLIF